MQDAPCNNDAELHNILGCDLEEHVPVPNDTDAGDVKAIENEPIEAQSDREVEVEEETTHPQHEPEIPNPEGQTPVSSVKTVELVECPDCNKK